MGKSVKIKDLLKPTLFHQVSGDETALEREVFVPEMNRPGFELAGFFKHTDFRRIILFGEKEISFFFRSNQRHTMKNLNTCFIM